MKVPSIFKNELVHYGLIFLAVLNIVGYVSARAYECLLLFGVGYYAANTYFKNIGLSILAALFFSNFIFGCGRVRESFLEGMKGAREHMLDSAVSSQKAAVELFQTADRMRRSSAFTNRSVIEAFVEGAEDQVKQADEQKEAADAAQAMTDKVSEISADLEKEGGEEAPADPNANKEEEEEKAKEEMKAARMQYKMNGMKRA